MEVAGKAIRRGTWLVSLSIGDRDIWKAIKTGTLRGISLSGSAQRDGTGNLRQLSVRELSIVAKPATNIPWVVTKSEDGISPELRARILEFCERAESQIALAKLEYDEKRKRIKRVLSDPMFFQGADGPDFSRMYDELRAATDGNQAECDRDNEILRARMHGRLPK